MTNIMALYPTPTHKTDDVLPCCIWNPQAPLQPSVSSSQNESVAISTECNPICFSFTYLEISFCGIPLRNIPPRKWKIRCDLERQVDNVGEDSHSVELTDYTLSSVSGSQPAAISSPKLVSGNAWRHFLL